MNPETGEDRSCSATAWAVCPTPNSRPSRIPVGQVPSGSPRRQPGRSASSASVARPYRSASRSATGIRAMRSFISGKADPQAALTNNRRAAPRRGRGTDDTGAAIREGWHHREPPEGGLRSWRVG
ncbi:hypothetical protein Ppa06_20770 [Planomonospora parontospora subsp. parontospora]|uniref:Uncharacterized protein n=2 Tax=Planomonospora parontospora TaxID=58119 RepID=A0AA37BFH5_9ACTN|nr:hypothetical protein GCM10010126_22780 [Planomonospora parontospora]GII08279.1 hypothetical protein Ppa06_20770 [Planomonospora parontospora subsp. parontospora]